MDTEKYSIRFCKQCNKDYPATSEFYYICILKNDRLKYRCRFCSRVQKKLLYAKNSRRACRLSGCENSSQRKGLCQRHYREQLYGFMEGCIIDGCTKQAYVARGLCGMHYRRLRVHGDVEVRLTKERAGLTEDGYRLLHGYHDHPNATANGAILEHRFIMSQMLGRPLFPYENVHHKNGQRSDNRPQNLELWIVSQPYGQRFLDVLTWAKDIVAQYGKLEKNPYFAPEMAV